MRVMAILNTKRLWSSMFASAPSNATAKTSTQKAAQPKSKTSRHKTKTRTQKAKQPKNG